MAVRHRERPHRATGVGPVGRDPVHEGAEGAATSAGRPAASRVPSRPASTSPAPAVASQGGRVGLRRTPGAPAPGGTTRVVAPLSSTVAPVTLGERAGVGERVGLDLLRGVSASVAVDRRRAG